MAPIRKHLHNIPAKRREHYLMVRVLSDTPVAPETMADEFRDTMLGRSFAGDIEVGEFKVSGVGTAKRRRNGQIDRLGPMGGSHAHAR